MRVLLVVVLALAAACRRDAVATRPNDPELLRAETETSELPRVRVLADVAEHHGRRVIVEGLYDIDPISRGKGGKLVWLTLLDGTRISRAYGPVEAELPYANRRVLATGRLTSGPPDPQVQALLAPHLAVEKLELAAGEPPLDPTVTEIPAPLVASTTPALAGHHERWVQVVGTLVTIDADATATLTLSDGGTVRVERVHRPEWSHHLGTTVTVIGRLLITKGASGAFTLALVIPGRAAICPGVVSRCGM